MKKFGARLKAAREAANLTQAQVAQGIHADIRSWGRWESEGKIPKLLTACKIALALNVDVLYLAGFVDKPVRGTQLDPDADEMLKLYTALSANERTVLLETLRDMRNVGRINRGY